MTSAIEVGAEVPSFRRTVGRQDVAAYAEACLSRWIGDPAAIQRFRAQFKSPVFMGDELEAGGRVTSVEDGIATVELWVTTSRDGETEYAIRRAEAQIRVAG
jgi:acyl dehydratase